MAWEQVYAEGGEGAGGVAWRNTATGEYAQYSPPGAGDGSAGPGFANPQDNPAQQAESQMRAAIGAAPLVTPSAIVAAPSYARPYYTLDVGGVTRYAVPKSIANSAVDGMPHFLDPGQSSPDGNAWSIVTGKGQLARVQGLGGDVAEIFDTAPVITFGRTYRDNGALLGEFSGGLKVIGAGLGISAGLNWLAGQGLIGAAGAAEALPFNPVADYGPAYFEGGSAYTAPAFDPVADFGPSYFGPGNPAPLMPPAVPETPAQLREWGLREVSPGTWAQPEIQLTAPSYLDQLARLASPITDAAAKVLTGAATSAATSAATRALMASGGSPSIRTDTRTPIATGAEGMDATGLLVILLVGTAVVAGAAALAKAKK